MSNIASHDVVGLIGRICHVDQEAFGLDALKLIGQNMSRELGFKYVLIGRPQQANNQVIQTEVTVADGQLVDDVQYNLEGTPCAQVITGRRVCMHTRAVAQRFPDDILLQEMGVEAYAGAPLIDPRGILHGLVVVLDDKSIEGQSAQLEPVLEFIAARVALEYAIQVREQQRMAEFEQLHHRQRLEALGNLTGGIAHDFNNLMGAILGHAELLKIRQAGNDEVLGHVDPIIESVMRGRQITQQLTDFTKPMETQSVSTCAHEVIDELVHLTGPNMRGINVQMFNRASRSSVAIAGNALQQVLLNLLLNAKDAMAGQGNLTLTTEDDENCLLINVLDDGPGIDSLTIDRIFDPFFTTKGTQGTGLGLSSSFGIVQSVGGNITVESELGKGTDFCIRLPLCQEVRPTQSSDSNRPKGERILIVDDEAHFLSYLKQRLELAGYAVTACTSLRDAQRVCVPNRFDLLICDLSFPTGTSGFFIRNSVQRSPSMHIILITGNPSQPDAQAISSLPRCRLLQKPFEYNELSAIIAELIPL